MIALGIILGALFALNGASGSDAPQKPDPVMDQAKLDAETKLFVKSGARPCENPRAVLLGGGMAAGKSSGERIWKPQLEATGCGFIVISTDDMMDSIPTYVAAINSGDRCASQRFHGPPAKWAYEFFERAVNRSLNVVFDGTMTNVPYFVEQAEKLKQTRYTVQMFGFTCAISTALERSWTRAAQNKRYVPICVIFLSHVFFAAAFEQYTKHFPDARLFDTEGTNFQSKEIYGGGVAAPGGIRVLDPAAYQRFLAQATATPISVEAAMKRETLFAYKEYNRLCGVCGADDAILTDFIDTRITNVSAMPCLRSANCVDANEAVCQMIKNAGGCRSMPAIGWPFCQKTCDNCWCENCYDSSVPNVCGDRYQCFAEAVHAYCPRLCGRCYSYDMLFVKPGWRPAPASGASRSPNQRRSLSSVRIAASASEQDDYRLPRFHELDWLT